MNRCEPPWRNIRQMLTTKISDVQTDAMTDADWKVQQIGAWFSGTADNYTANSHFLPTTELLQALDFEDLTSRWFKCINCNQFLFRGSGSFVWFCLNGTVGIACRCQTQLLWTIESGNPIRYPPVPDKLDRVWTNTFSGVFPVHCWRFAI